MPTFTDLGIQLPYRATGEVRAVCPQCTPGRSREHQREKDLAVNVPEQTWLCHHCGWSGTLVPKRGEYGSRLPSWEKPRPLVKPETNVVEAMYAWFERERGISRAVVDRNRIVPVNTERGWAIAFPHFRDGEHIGTQYRTKDKQIWQEKGAERIFYGLDDITPDTRELVICEGQIDKLAFEEAGLTNVISVPDGAPAIGTKNYGSKLSYLESAKDVLDRMERVYLACDNDAPGQALNEELARRIGREKCWTVQWREGIKDANDALREIGVPEIEESLELAKPYPIEGVVTVDDVWDALLDAYDHGYDRGFTIGLEQHDKHYRPKPGLLSIISGHASHGKTKWLNHVLVRLAGRHDWRFAIFSPENFPVDRHLSELAEIHVSKAFDKGFINYMHREELEAAKDWLDDHFTFIVPDSPHIDAILERSKALLFRKGITGLVMDPWNEIEHACPKGQNVTDYISEVLGKIKRFAQVNSIHVWLLAHPTKIKQFTAKEEVPTLTDISGSINFRNKADYGVVIWRDMNDKTAPAECHIQKIRFAETGDLGKVLFRYDNVRRQIVEVTA